MSSTPLEPPPLSDDGEQPSAPRAATAPIRRRRPEQATRAVPYEPTPPRANVTLPRRAGRRIAIVPALALPVVVDGTWPSAPPHLTKEVRELSQPFDLALVPAMAFSAEGTQAKRSSIPRLASVDLEGIPAPWPTAGRESGILGTR